MVATYYFGQYRINISTNEELLKQLPNSWQKYTEKKILERNITLLQVKEDSDLCFGRYPDGWTILSDYGSTWKVVYSRFQKVIFALYHEAHTDTVEKEIIIINNKRYNSFLLGLQFGLLTGFHRSCIGLHGVTLLCKNEIIILSAPSGTGKTTLARLLEQYYDAIVLNGDFAFLSVSDDGVIFEPTPFCGTSRRCLNHRVRINRIVFLEQSVDNMWITLDGRMALIKCLDNVFVPEWNRDMLHTIQKNIMRLIKFVNISMFAFAPVPEAARMFSEKISNRKEHIE